MASRPAATAEPLAAGRHDDVEFARVGDVVLTLDAFVPAGPGPFPACILVHGGGFVRGDKQSYIKPLFDPLSQAGFAWFTINYRLAPQHRWPACAEDVATAIRWVKAHAAEYRVDARRLALIGESAGGHLVSYVGTQTQQESSVAAIVSFYAPHDLDFQVRQRGALGESMTGLLGLTELNDQAWRTLREASPDSYVRPRMPPYLLIHGDQDQTVPYEQSVRFARKMTAAGNECNLITVPRGIHGMGGWAQLGSDYREQMIAWLRKHLPGSAVSTGSAAVPNQSTPGAAESRAAESGAAASSGANSAANRSSMSRSPRYAEAETDTPLPPDEAARTMIVPDGFRVSLFAGEPDVMQPIAFCVDDRGRLWVAEAFNYPQHGTKPGDRVIILEDSDNDGQFDKRTVFYDQLNYVTGIEVGFGGAWVMSPPYFCFIPDRNGDDRPDGEPQVLLDGFGNHANSHNLANGFAWGPDGWLYGTHGRTNWSMIGKPGTPDAQRRQYDGGVYRYHPVRHVWEPYADGTTNPWGIDWDDFGQSFVCNCVDPHLFHVLPGAHYEPWRNRASSEYAYERIDTIADHLHFTGLANVRDGLGSLAEDEAGGGHAHCGTLIYLGDSWPDSYRNTVLLNNIHGHRINNDILRRVGSGYSAAHGRDLLRARDTWFMGVTLQGSPDGSVFASDWSDTGECHSVKNTRRHTGRIFKISYGPPRPRSADPSGLSDAALVELQLHRNDWYVRHARRVLQERAATGHDMASVHPLLQKMFADQRDVTRQLRALWALHVTGGLSDTFLIEQLSHPNEHVRVWCIQLLCEDHEPPPEALDRFALLARHDNSPLVRVYLASMLQRLPLPQRWSIAGPLMMHGEDTDDANLPKMIWYAIEPLVAADAARAIALVAQSPIPLLRVHVARRVLDVTDSDEGLSLLVAHLAEVDASDRAFDWLSGILQGLEGRRSVAMPPRWRNAYTRLQQLGSPPLREQAVRLALIFDDPAAIRQLFELAGNRSAPAEDRNGAIHALVAKKEAGLARLLLELTEDHDTQRAALRGLAEYDDPATATTILNRYDKLDSAARQDALQTLAARKSWAKALLDAVQSQRVPRQDLTAYTARQLRSLGDQELSARVTSIWGELRSTPSDKARLIADYKRRLTPEVLQRADRVAGQATFQKSCANCHRLFGNGATIGPDLTGAQRHNLDYVLENIIDPSASVARDFQMQVITTTSGRLVTGLAVAETPNALTVQTVNEKLVVPTSEIEDRSTSNVSLMPEGLFQDLDANQIRDLIAYLAYGDGER